MNKNITKFSISTIYLPENHITTLLKDNHAIIAKLVKLNPSKFLLQLFSFFQIILTPLF